MTAKEQAERETMAYRAGEKYKKRVEAAKAEYAESVMGLQPQIRAKDDELKYRSRIVKKESHSKEQTAMVEAYHAAVNQKLLAFVDKINRLKDSRLADKMHQEIIVATHKEAADIHRLTGIDVSDYTRDFSGSSVNHIKQRHGVRGKQDDTMAFAEDVARIEYVLKNYDDIGLAPPVAKGRSEGYHNSDGSPAIKIEYEKKIDGVYYVIEAVPDSKSKKLQIVDAYFSNKKRSTANNLVDNSPHPTSETSHAPASFDDKSISQSPPPVKGGLKDLGVPKAVDETLGALPKGAAETLNTWEKIKRSVYKGVFSGQSELERLSKLENQNCCAVSFRRVLPGGCFAVRLPPIPCGYGFFFCIASPELKIHKRQRTRIMPVASDMSASITQVCPLCQARINLPYSIPAKYCLYRTQFLCCRFSPVFLHRKLCHSLSPTRMFIRQRNAILSTLPVPQLSQVKVHALEKNIHYCYTRSNRQI